MLNAHIQITAKLNIRTAARHIGRDSHSAGNTSLRDDRGFFVMESCIQYPVLNTALCEVARETLRFFNRDRTDKHRLFLGRTAFNFVDNGFKLLAFCTVYNVIIINPLNGAVGRNNEHFKTISLSKFTSFRFGCTCHARQFVIETEIIL